VPQFKQIKSLSYTQTFMSKSWRWW